MHFLILGNTNFVHLQLITAIVKREDLRTVDGATVCVFYQLKSFSAVGSAGVSGFYEETAVL